MKNYIHQNISRLRFALQTSRNSLVEKIRLSYFRFSLFRRIGAVPSSYINYLDIQLRRSLLKKQPNNKTKLHTMLLIDKLSEYVDLSTSRVLCIGCRDRTEVEYFISKGSKEVVGIDLFSQDMNILVMDMHNLTFPDNQFTIIYSSHSLEHAYDAHKVAKEMIRVSKPGTLIAIEVPVHYKTRGADLIDFQNLENIRALFGIQMVKTLWSEELPSGDPRNDAGTAIGRTIFLIEKKADNFIEGLK